ncbi:HAMP domain-containing sensor histidine kinase [Sinomicrobium oceani]|uniref:HAMP domain-containing sensor histidine kinase n=1 Tax=Sinomicrobium oceani TaxID=1150368 RepID=UPI000930C5DE|nr:HAMP domain-containing sensor histidine kinase [Sinomicrobium oceani]
MTIRKKILVYFTAAVIPLLGLSLFLIYTLFYEYREEEFQQSQKQKITATLQYLAEVQKVDNEILLSYDRKTIDSMYDEKLLIYNSNKKRIYASLDDTMIPYAETILNDLSPNTQWIETKDGTYDVVGIYFESGRKSYYGISKAYDALGYSKLGFLRNTLILIFVIIALVLILISYYLSRKISGPIMEITRKITRYDLESEDKPITVQGGEKEIVLLTNRFNQLIHRIREAFAFQKYAIHHISHELKTPIAVLVSNFEKLERETDPQVIQKQIRRQKEDTKNLGEIINVLLEIAKAESADGVIVTKMRVDELIFDLVEELNLLFPDHGFHVTYAAIPEDDSVLTVSANERLLRAAFSNLMLNSIHYGSNHRTQIRITTFRGTVKVDIINTGKVIAETEKQYLFRHFFRGDNSRGKPGFGLGLVFIHKIMQLHRGSIAYNSENGDTNIFTVILPLS